MNDEIKEILEQLEWYRKIGKKDVYYPECVLPNKKAFILLDYITNLQQENERLKKALNCKEYFSSTMPEDTEFVILTKNNYDRQQKDIQLELIDYKSRCEKAIESLKLKQIRYVNESDYVIDDGDLQEEINILQNGDDE